MAECRWIQKLSFLILMLQCNAAETRQNIPTIVVRVGDEATLPCRAVTDVQPDCGSTAWIFSRGLTSVDTVQLIPQLSTGEKSQNKSDRLRVTADCSLLIKNITADDVGRYSCGHSTSHTKQDINFDVHLSVINMTEHENDGKVVLFCSVLEYDACAHTVQWMYEGEEKLSDMEISERSCDANVTFTISDLNQKSKFYELLKCKVINQNTKKEKLFSFSRQSSGGTTGEAAPTGPSLPYIIAPVCLAALLIVVAVVIWRKTKGKKTQMEENTVSLNSKSSNVGSRVIAGSNGVSLNPAETRSGPGTCQHTDDPEDDVNYVSISHTRKVSSKASARVRDDEGDTVTYSAVTAPSSSLEVSIDPNNLYSTIKK